MDFLRFCSRIFTFSLAVATSTAYRPAGWSNDKTVAVAPEWSWPVHQASDEHHIAR